MSSEDASGAITRAYERIKAAAKGEATDAVVAMHVKDLMILTAMASLWWESE